MDWKYLSSINPEDLNDEEKDNIFSVVTWFDLENERPNLEQSKILLGISQELLKFKGEQVETLLHELDEIAIKQGEEEAKIIESDADVRSLKSRKSSAFEVENLEQRYHELRTKYKKQQRINEKYVQEINTLKETVKSLQHENNQLEREIESSKRDASDTSEVSDTIKDQHRELVETVHNKNKQLSGLLHDIEDVEKENQFLREKMGVVRDELSTATSEIQNQMEKLKSMDLQLEETQDTVKKLTTDNDLLQEEVQELNSQKSQMELQLKEFTKEINERIDAWQKVLEEKDVEIKDLKAKSSEISRHSSLSDSSIEGQAHISALQKLLIEREAQLVELQNKLQDAVKEMEASTDLIETLKRKNSELNKENADLSSTRRELKKQLRMAHERGQKLQEEVEYLEGLAESRSEDMKKLVGQLKDNGHLEEAQIVEEMQELKALNRINEKQITSLVKNINKVQDDCDQMAKENLFMREKLGIPDEEQLPHSNYHAKHKQYKKELSRMKRKLLQFEEENIDLRTELKNLNKTNLLLKERAEVALSKLGLENTEAKVDEEKNAEERTLQELDKVIDAEMLSLSLGEVDPVEQRGKEEGKIFEREMKKVCEENEALRKGMHEILNSLNAKKETSLRQIESDTFEKLLRALDVKHISGWYHPAMRLQAEVHNVEGINKELREQLRVLRLEIEELRNEKQENLILLSRRSTMSSPRHLTNVTTLKDMKTLEDLNENVDVLLERSSEDTQTCQEIAANMENFNRDFAAVERQLQNLRDLSVEEKRASDEKRAELEARISELETELQVSKEKLKAFDMDASVDDSVKKMAEINGEIIRANLKRGFLEVECRKLREKVDALKEEALSDEAERAKRSAEWFRIDSASRKRIVQLEASLEQCVGLEEHRKLRKELENLTVKFRDLMEDYKRLEQVNQFEMDVLKRSREMVEDEKLELKNKLNDCLTNLNALQGSSTSVDDKVNALSKKLSESEIHVMGERQRANHVNNLYELVKDQLNKSEEKFREYETHTTEIMHKNLLLQSQMKEVEDKLRDFVDLELYNAVLEEHKMALKRADELSAQVGKLTEEKQILEATTRTTNLWTAAKEDEFLALKHHVVDLLADSDDKAVIARVSSDLVQARTNEKEWRNKYEIISAQLGQCHDEWLDSLKMLDEQKEKHGVREKHLKKKNRVLQDLLENQKLQYFGCVPLTSEQRFVDNLKLTRDNNHASFLSLYRAQNLENESLILKEQTEIDWKNCLDARKICEGDAEEVQKILCWLQEKNRIELELIRFRRQAEFKDLQLQQSNERIQIQSEQIAELEEEMFLSRKEFDFETPKKEKASASEEISRSTKSQDVQTENCDEGELLSAKKELEAKEEAVQQLRNKLSDLEMNCSLFRKQIGDKQSQISFYEKHILELQQTKREEVVAQRSQDGGTASPDTGEDSLALKASIKALQETISVKEETILHYQSLLKEDRDNHSLAAARMQEELKLLKCSLVEEKQKRTEYEDPAGEACRSKAAIQQYVKQVHALEEHADQLHTQVTTLESQLQSSRQEAVRWRSLANDRLQGIEEMRQSLEEQHRNELNVYKKDSEKWREEVLSLKELINKHKNEILQVQPDLQNLLKAKDEKIHELSVMVMQLGEEIKKETDETDYPKKAELETTIDSLMKDNESLKKRMESLLKKERHAREEIRALKGQLLKSSNKRPVVSARVEKSDKTIKEHLQKKVATLEEEVERLKEELANQVALNETHRVKIDEDFDRWKRQKQNQQTIEKLKTKVKEKDAEVMKMQQTCSGYRSLIERLEREKHSLENRVKALKTNMNVYSMGGAQQNEALTSENDRLASEVEELRAKLEVQQRHAGGLGAAMMQEKLEAQERKLAIMELTGKGTVEIRTEMEKLQSSISSLQKSNLFLEAKNIELKMDLEKSQKDLPRFREQIQHLESYIEVLKVERSNPQTSQSFTEAPHNIQESRKVAELERTLLVLKRVVEKLQTENKRLASGKRPVSDRSGSGEKLRRDFNHLKEQYNESLRKISELDSALNATTSRLKTLENVHSDSDDVIVLSNELSRVKEQLDQKAQLLDKVKVLLQRAAVKEKNLLKEIADLKMRLTTISQQPSIQIATRQV